jgi:hypothetical protein
VADAEILVHAHPAPAAAAHGRHAGHKDEFGGTLIKVVTNDLGIAGFATPADVPPARIVLSVRHANYNPRHLRLDGTNLCIDLRRELYGYAP